MMRLTICIEEQLQKKNKYFNGYVEWVTRLFHRERLNMSLNNAFQTRNQFILT